MTGSLLSLLADALLGIAGGALVMGAVLAVPVTWAFIIARATQQLSSCTSGLPAGRLG